MAVNTLIQLPYFAPAPVPLPTYEEIVAHVTSVGGAQNPARTIVKLGKLFVAKYGKTVNFVEGENMLIVQQHTNIRIPALYAMYRHEPSGNNVIIMEYVAGEVLSNCYHRLNDNQKASVGAQLRCQLSELRKIPSPGFYGLSSGRPYLANWLFKSRVGPFDSAREFLEAYISAHFILDRFGRLMMEDVKHRFLELSKNHDAPVFTHADLHTGNIIMREDGSLCIIDWESASYCPEYVEFFVIKAYDMMTFGLSENDNNWVLEYAEMVQLKIKMWDIYEDYDLLR